MFGVGGKKITEVADATATALVEGGSAGDPVGDLGVAGGVAFVLGSGGSGGGSCSHCAGGIGHGVGEAEAGRLAEHAQSRLAQATATIGSRFERTAGILQSAVEIQVALVRGAVEGVGRRL